MLCVTRTTARRWVVVVLLLLLASASVTVVYGWGSSSGNGDESMYGNAALRDWLYDGSSISLQLEGCMYGYVDNDNEDSGCMENDSSDGTTYWYMMANCRRAQAVFSIYASSSGTTSCNSGNFKEAFVTKNGIGEFVYYLQNYDPNSPFGDNYAYDDDDAYDDLYGDDGGNNNDDGNYDELPMCEEADGYYVGMACSSDGGFSQQYFDDEYCLSLTGNTYDRMKRFNRLLRTYQNCQSIYSPNNYNDDNNGNGNYLAVQLIYNAMSCGSADSSLCANNDYMSNRMSHSSSSRMTRNRRWQVAGKTWLTKLKYVAGGLLLLASFVMFTGILFTNRRRRRALMQRKYRQSKHRDRETSSRKSKNHHSSSRSKSKGSKHGGSKRSSKSRSKSRGDRGGGGGRSDRDGGGGGDRGGGGDEHSQHHERGSSNREKSGSGRNSASNNSDSAPAENGGVLA